MTQLRLASALLLSLVLASGARALEAGKPLPEGPEGEVLAAEAERQRAFIDADVDAVGRLCGDELRVTHANGSVQTKYRLIAALESGRLDYVAIQSSGEEVHVYGEAAVLAGTARVQIKLPDGARRTIESVYTAVYAKRDGAWLLVAYQSTEAAKDPEPATS